MNDAYFEMTMMLLPDMRNPLSRPDAIANWLGIREREEDAMKPEGKSQSVFPV